MRLFNPPYASHNIRMYAWHVIKLNLIGADDLPYQHCLSQFQINSYAVPVVELVEEAVRKYSVSSNSVINFGCATGLTSFLLSTAFQKVCIIICTQKLQHKTPRYIAAQKLAITVSPLSMQFVICMYRLLALTSVVGSLMLL